MSYASVSGRLPAIRLIAMDVDGVLTEGLITYVTTVNSSAGEPGNRAVEEAKTFSARDGLGLSLARAAGLELAWVTGRVSPVVRKRADELRVHHVCQWARNKRRVLGDLLAQLGLRAEEALYVGDDLNDLPAFEAVGIKVAVADAAQEVRDAADWVTETPGGRGAIREVVEGVLRGQGRWEEAVRTFLAELEKQQDAPPPAQ